MPKEIFDQDRPRSAMARRLDEAFAGCDQWTVAPPPQRSDEAGLNPWPVSTVGLSGSAAGLSAQEQRAV
jgi:hypothetical protein